MKSILEPEEPRMNLRVETQSPRPGVAVIALAGEVDVYTSPRVKQEIVNLLNSDTTRMVVDLSAVEYLDSTGLGVLIGGLKRTRERDGDLKLICDNSRILRIFEITGLTKIFDIYRSEPEALERLEAA
jgi:anti-sigma B factor antagonist